MKSNAQTFKPRFSETSIADAAQWLNRPDWICQVKADGVWHEENISGSVIVGERMRDGSIFVFDLPICSGQNLRCEPLRFRLDAMRDFLATCRDSRLREMPSGRGSAFLEKVLADGGEGVVCKPLDAAYGVEWLKVKRCQTYDCRVSEKHAWKQSVAIQLDGENVGWLPLRGTSFDRVNVGDCVEVAAHSRHTSGKLREARFVRVRLDKPNY